MARLEKRATPDDETNYDQSSHWTGATESSANSFSSDKENQISLPRIVVAHTKSSRPITGSQSTSSSSNKRRKLGDRAGLEPSQAVLQKELEYVEDTQYYDPEQPIRERRAVRKEIRHLTRDLAGWSHCMSS